MKIPFNLLAAAALTATAMGCSSYLDINNNPNSPLTATPDAILASALVTTAANYTGGQGANGGDNFNSYGSWTAGFWARSGTVNGYVPERTYTYTTTFYDALFNNTYDNLTDYNIIQKQGAADYPNHAAIARIMKAYNYLLLVDEYGDIPYTKALGGLSNIAPTYDKAADIYKDLLVQLAGAVADINTAANATPASRSVGSEDVVFAGNMTQWQRFANSLQLRILLRESQTSDAALNASVATQLAALQTAAPGFITADVVVQPGYLQSSTKQNPLYNRYGVTAAGSSATERSYQLPTKYILAQYINNKDPRVSQLYATAPILANGTPAVTGYVGAELGEKSPVLGSGLAGGSRFRVGGTILKGFNAPTPLMLLSEQLFSKAEAETRNLFTGGDAAAKMDFNDGILAAFNFTYRPATSGPAVASGTTQYAAYVAANPTNPLVNYDLATSNGALGKQAVIIYQKYLSLNSWGSIEAWDDYRRTAQPKIPASLESTSPRPDKLPTRLLYPQSEVSANSANIPAGTTQFTKIFWDSVD